MDKVLGKMLGKVMGKGADRGAEARPDPGVDARADRGAEARPDRRAEARPDRGADRGADEVRPYPTRARLETIFATAHPESDPEGIISRYLEFELFRFRQDSTFAIRGTLPERLKALHWYLCGYGPHRALQLPLSRAQIAFLNAPVPIVGLGIEISIGAYSFITAERGENLDLRDDAVLREHLFWWATERSTEFAPGGELITPAQVRALQFTGHDETGRKFPLNYFARRTQKLDPSLEPLNLDLATDRAALLAILMLRCAKHPYTAQFLPGASVAELLSVRDGEASDPDASQFDTLLALAFGGEAGAPSTEAAEFRRLLEQRLAQAGYSFTRAGRAPGAGQRNAGLCYMPDPGLRPGLDPGIAVIGPTRATSGLGQATRLSIDVLDHLGLDPAIVDFGLDNPAPVGFASTTKAPHLQVPRQINLLHLNAESIPLAFGFLNNAIFDRSYNIGYFFWELNQIPKCQRLALDLLDEIWVSGEYNREIYSRFTDIPVHNVGMAVEPLPSANPMTRAQLGLPESAYIFLATFDSFSFIERKNPLGILAAFQAAFPPGSGEDVALVLKTQNRTRVGDPHQVRVWQAIDDIVQRDPRIRIVDQTFSYRDLLGFKRACDCYVSLHRSEGWGFGIIEAMQLRLPVIATAYSGNMEFCSPATAALVDYTLVPPMPDEYIFVERGSLWADPSTATAAAAMREVVAQPDQARARAEEAFRFVQSAFGIEAIAKRYGARIAEIQESLKRVRAEEGDASG